MTDRDNLLAEIKKKAVVHGKVVLSSGREADFYLDLRRITLDAVAAPLVGRVMLDLTEDLGYDAVGGLTLGADPVATAMLHAAAARGRELDAYVVRKAQKAHGLQRRIEGPEAARDVPRQLRAQVEQARAGEQVERPGRIGNRQTVLAARRTPQASRTGRWAPPTASEPRAGTGTRHTRCRVRARTASWPTAPARPGASRGSGR